MKKNGKNQVMGWVKWVLLFYLLAFLPLSLLAQDDDLYFVPKKASKVEQVTDNYGLPKDTYYSGSDRSVDEYNRRTKSSYVVIDGDSTKVDVIEFTEGKGVYPDSVDNEDFKLTKKMSRFDDYDASQKAAYWAGYDRGRYDWGWHSPWYYRTYGWYGWRDPWYYGGWYGSYYPWYDPWYYGGWYDPWGYPYYRYGYYGYYGYPYPYYISVGGSVGHSPRYRHSPRQPFASEGSNRSGFGNSSGRSGGRGSFGASRGRVTMPSSSGNGSYGGSRNGSGSFGASRSSSSSGGFSGGSRGGGGGSFGGSGGGSHGGGGGGFGRHR